TASNRTAGCNETIPISMSSARDAETMARRRRPDSVPEMKSPPAAIPLRNQCALPTGTPPSASSRSADELCGIRGQSAVPSVQLPRAEAPRSSTPSLRPQARIAYTALPSTPLSRTPASPEALSWRDGSRSVAERAGGVGGQPERAEGAGGQRRSAAERVVAGRSRHELRRSARGPGAELRAGDAPADDDAIEQRRRKRREIDGG